MCSVPTRASMSGPQDPLRVQCTRGPLSALKGRVSLSLTYWHTHSHTHSHIGTLVSTLAPSHTLTYTLTPSNMLLHTLTFPHTNARVHTQRYLLSLYRNIDDTQQSLIQRLDGNGRGRPVGGGRPHPVAAAGELRRHQVQPQDQGF